MIQLPQHSLCEAFSSRIPLSFLGVGDGISALLATRSGASALWASSLCVSTSLGLRDASELTITELSRAVAMMRNQTNLPILVDGDSGYGENHVTLRLCKELFRSGASGICLEDKPFPKINSHFGEEPELVDLDSFCNKLDCIKQSLSKDFFLVARTEAFVAKKSLEEGLHRCEAYVEAGADAIVFTLRKLDELLLKGFSKKWAHSQIPVLFIPPPNARIKSETIFSWGYRGVIWANQSMRSALKTFEETCRHILAEGNSPQLEDRCLSMNELFEYLRYPEIESLNQIDWKSKCKRQAS